MPLPRVPHVRGLLLAAGSGRRMGSPKALLHTAADQPTLVEQAIGVMLDGGCDGVTVVIGAAGPEVRAIAGTIGRDVDVLECPDWQSGMGASLRSGLLGLAKAPREGSGPVEAVLVNLVDLPDVGPEVIDRVLGACDPATWRANLSRAAYGGRPGHPVLIGRDHWADVAGTAVGDRGARDYVQANEHHVVECGDLATGRDVDTPGDLARHH